MMVCNLASSVSYSGEYIASSIFFLSKQFVVDMTTVSKGEAIFVDQGDEGD
jgi:hypothetical protein